MKDPNNWKVTEELTSPTQCPVCKRLVWEDDRCDCQTDWGDGPFHQDFDNEKWDFVPRTS